MFESTIGETAGKVWQLLSDKGPHSPTAISKTLAIKPTEVERALGWLAREDKLEASPAGKHGLKIALKH